MRLLVILALVAGCKKEVRSVAEEREAGITIHRVGDSCVALYVQYNATAMATVPCPAERSTP